ncbi:MAG TPA: DUF3300 domain-containing protein [Burkholderiaceae bacterium]|nr:DUF3300 domain-containing protein [Burkholderiaceae bacterium]
MNMSRFKATCSRTRTAWSAMVAVGMAILFSAAALAQAPAAAGGAAPPQPAEDLTQLVGRIALYPDDLIAIILPAATSPLQIVQADRYLDKRKSDPKLPIDDKWDDPVKSLLNYPDVVKMMSNDLDWTSALGEEVVADQGAVLEAVQVFRRQAQSAGNLKSDTRQVVKTEKEVIIIEPADPQVVYVPQYNPSTVVVYGAAPAWGYYPTPYPSYYYPYAPGAAMAAGVIWGAAIGAAWSGNRYGWGGGNDININRNTNVNVGSGNTINRGQGGGGGQWKSNKQPGQVSSSVGKTAPSNRAGDARGGAGGGARASAQPAGGADRGGAAGAGDRGEAGRGGAGAGGDRGGAGAGGGARASTQPAGGGGRGGGGDSAFGGYNSGRQTQMDSSRGASSRSSSYGGGGGSRPTASTGASRGGGGGGAARGGGGGGRGGGGRR